MKVWVFAINWAQLKCHEHQNPFSMQSAYLHVCTNSGHLATLAEKFCVVVPNNLGTIIAVFLKKNVICISSVR